MDQTHIQRISRETHDIMLAILEESGATRHTETEDIENEKLGFDLGSDLSSSEVTAIANSFKNIKGKSFMGECKETATSIPVDACASLVREYVWVKYHNGGAVNWRKVAQVVKTTTDYISEVKSTRESDALVRVEVARMVAKDMGEFIEKNGGWPGFGEGIKRWDTSMLSGKLLVAVGAIGCAMLAGYYYYYYY